MEVCGGYVEDMRRLCVGYGEAMGRVCGECEKVSGV